MTSFQLEATQSFNTQHPNTEHSTDERSPSSQTIVTVGIATPYPKSEVKRSLRASTLDGAFSSAFENVVRGVLIGNFLLGLGAGAFEIGLLTSIPMLAHLLQPVGAYFSEKTTSRHNYCLLIYSLSRLLWLLPAAGIFGYSHGLLDAHMLTLLTMAVLTLSNVLDSMGSASWMSWMAVLVPAQLRGRYFSLRRSLSSLVALVTIPLGGWLVSSWMGGEVEGYAIALIAAVVMGLLSLAFQFRMMDVNPQAEAAQQAVSESVSQAPLVSKDSLAQQDTGAIEQSRWKQGLLGDKNFLTLLLFLGLWTFGLNLSAPFFNLYLLDSLQIDVQWVTVYSGLIHGAFFLTIMLWGRLADRIGNRPVLIVSGTLMAILPLLWLYAGSYALSLWLLLPLLHIAQGSGFAALELCLANIQMELAPPARQSGYFAIAAALMGVTGALGTTVGSLLAELPGFSLPLLFACSALVRLLGLTPLLWVKEPRAQSVRSLLNDKLLQKLDISQPIEA